MAYPPLLSRFLVHSVRAGDRIAALGFAGACVFLPEAPHAEHILHLRAGSSSVPNVSMVKDALHRHPEPAAHVRVPGQTWDDVIFGGLLSQLSVEHPSRLQVIHTLTREPDRSPARRRRAQRACHGRTSWQRAETRTAFANLHVRCGHQCLKSRALAVTETTPAPRFLETMMSHLASLGASRRPVKMEAFGSTSQPWPANGSGRCRSRSCDVGWPSAALWALAARREVAGGAPRPHAGRCPNIWCRRHRPDSRLRCGDVRAGPASQPHRPHGCVEGRVERE